MKKSKHEIGPLEKLTPAEAYAAGRIVGMFEGAGFSKAEAAHTLGIVENFLARGRRAQEAVDAILLKHPADNS
jgi:hypothetical protein